MKKRFMKKDIVIFISIITSLIILDYFNLPSLLGVEMSNLNWDFCVGILNSIIVIVLFVITYRTLDERTIEREKNKIEISELLIKECYHECKKYVDLLNQETVEKFIVPKIDFNSTNNPIITNLQNSPFSSENIIMDLVKDGQVTKKQIEGYLKIREKYMQYVNMRITFFDAIGMYAPLENDLRNVISIEIEKLD